MEQTLAQLIDNLLANTLPKVSPGLAATIDRLIAAGENEEQIIQAVSDAFAKATARPSDTSIAQHVIVAYIRRSFANRTSSSEPGA